MTPIDGSVPQVVRLQSQLEALQSVSQALFQRTSINDFIKIALEVASEVSETQAASVLMASPPGQNLIFYEYTHGYKIDRDDRGAAWWVFQSGQSIIIQDCGDGPQYLTGIGDLNRSNTRDLLALPLKRGDGQPIGVLEIRNKRHGLLDDADRRILTVISGFIAMAIEQHWLAKEVAQHRRAERV